MIESIHIINFESHKDTLIPLHPGMNTITGTTDSGKSGIKRAYEWITDNKPGGDAFRSDWGGETSVAIKLTDGNLVKRVKGTGNEYWLNETKFTAFGSKVPDEILQVLNLNEINLQSQFDSHFLLSETPGKVAAHFNKVANLEKIDVSQANLKQANIKIKQSLVSKKESKKELKVSLKTFDFLEKLEIDLEILEEREKNYLVQVKQIAKLTKPITRVKEIERELNQFSKITVFEKDFKSIIKDIEFYEDSKFKYNTLFTFIESLKITEKDLKELSKLTGLGESVNKILALIKSKAVSIGNHERLRALMVSISENKESALNKRKTVDKLELKFKENFPETCPLCEIVINK